MNVRRILGLAAVSLMTMLAVEGLGRGFGGHGGGGGRGGFHGGGGGFSGNISRGAPRPGGGFGGGNPGGLDRGQGQRPGAGGFDRALGGGPAAGGFNRGALNPGAGDRGIEGWNHGNFGQVPSRSGLNNFLGLPSDEGMHGAGSRVDVDHGSVEGPRGGEAHGTTIEGPRGNTVGRGAAEGPNGGVAAGRGVKGADGGVAGQGAIVGPNGRVAAGEGVRGAGGRGAARGFVAGPKGIAAGYTHVTPIARHTTGVAVRNNFHDWNIYGHRWYTNHPGAWFAAGWAANTAWNACTWNALGGWFAYPADVEPIYYDYGTSVTYDAGNVAVDGQDIGTADDYYQQAQALAGAGAAGGHDVDPAATEGDWMPLGVFALSRAGHEQSVVAIQLAVNKQGIIRGNYTDTFSDDPLQIHGSVDKKTQRVAFTVGDKTQTVFDTGLYNLTKEEAPLLIHFGKERTEQWILVRLNQPEEVPNPNDGTGESH